MHINSLKERIERSDYTVDADAVAEALLRRPAARRTILPGVNRPGARTRASERLRPAELNATPAAPGTTPPTQVTPAIRALIAGPTQHAQLEVLAAGRRERGRVPPSARATSATPGASGKRVEVDRRSARRCAGRGGRASVAIPSERSIIACAPAAASARPSARRGSGRR